MFCFVCTPYSLLNTCTKFISENFTGTELESKANDVLPHELKVHLNLLHFLNNGAIIVHCFGEK